MNKHKRTPKVQAIIAFPQLSQASGPLRVRMMVTPRQAADWLTKNVNNRNLREGMSLRYAQDMESGRWVYNGDPIRFSPTGDLTDGQHRLTGCVLAKVPFDTDVIFNLETRLCDLGGGRTASDMAHLSGMKNSARATALAKLILIHRKHGIERLNTTNLHPSKTEILIEAQGNPDIQSSIVSVVRKIAPPSVTDFCYYLFRKQNPEMARKFMTDVLTGESISAGSAAFLLRNRLINNTTAKGKLNSLYMIALFFVAWRYYREGKSLKCLKWMDGEEFPVI